MLSDASDAPDAIDADGWHSQAQRHPSPNYTARASQAIALIVIHNISLPPGVFGGDDIIHLFTNRLAVGTHPAYRSLAGVQVAAHFLIRRGGELLQFVSCHDAAYHAGESCWRGRAQCNAFSIGIELEGTDTTPYAEAQYQRLLALLADLLEAYPAAQIAGHCDIAPARKTDPGVAFDWARIFAHLGNRYDGRAA